MQLAGITNIRKREREHFVRQALHWEKNQNAHTNRMISTIQVDDLNFYFADGFENRVFQNSLSALNRLRLKFITCKAEISLPVSLVNIHGLFINLFFFYSLDYRLSS